MHMKCPECNASVEENLKTCPNCGFPIEVDKNDEKQTIELEKKVKAKGKDNRRKGPIAAGLIVVMIILVNVYMYYVQNASAQEYIRDNIQGEWISLEAGEDRSIEFDKNLLTYSVTDEKYDEDLVINGNGYLNWRAVTGEQIKIDGKKYRVAFEEGNDIINFYPALTNDEEFETFRRKDSTSEWGFNAMETKIESMDMNASTTSAKYSMINEGEDTYNRILLAWEFLAADEKTVLDRKYFMLKPKDGALEPGEKEIFTISISSDRINNLYEIENHLIYIAGQEKNKEHYIN